MASDFKKFGQLVRGYGFNSVSLSRVLGCSPPTAMKKIQEPRLFTLEDISNLSIKGHIPIDEIRTSITVKGQ